MPISVLALFITNGQLQYLRGLHLSNELIVSPVSLITKTTVLFAKILSLERTEDPLICPLRKHPPVSVVIYYLWHINASQYIKVCPFVNLLERSVDNAS